MLHKETQGVCLNTEDRICKLIGYRPGVPEKAVYYVEKAGITQLFPDNSNFLYDESHFPAFLPMPSLQTKCPPRQGAKLLGGALNAKARRVNHSNFAPLENPTF